MRGTKFQLKVWNYLKKIPKIIETPTLKNAISTGNKVSIAAPKKAPCINPKPPTTIIKSKFIETRRLNVSLLKTV